MLNKEKIADDLKRNILVVAEGIQTILRREGVEGAYEMLKELTRTNTTIDHQAIFDFIENLPVTAEIKTELHAITPENYTGINLLRQDS